MPAGAIKERWETRTAAAIEWLGVAVLLMPLLGLLVVPVVATAWLIVATAVFLVPIHVGCRMLRRQGRRKEFQALKAYGFRVCPECRYDLSTLRAIGACPECGKAYMPESLEADWIAIYGASDWRM